MKKIFALLSIVLTITLVYTSVTVFAQDGKVGISFCVGDDTLIINGEPVKVEKPYVVGDGVTLVPLRVITEAFGAKVEWIDETQTVNISYPQVEIVLQIDNMIADVNNKAQTLLAAPELTESGYTMVPLRFISENFGADVSYDDATERITVVKDVSNSDNKIVVGDVTQSKIGDSYYDWSMDKPHSMTMTDRTFAGTYTTFEADDSTWIDINIYAINDDYNFERDFIEAKNSFQGYTLIKADKNTSDANKKAMHFQVKDKECFMDVYRYVNNKYIYDLYGEAKVDDTESINAITGLLASFDCVYSKQDVYDLSEVVNGTRKYKSEKMRFSLNIPQNFYLSTYDELDNEVTFYIDDGDDYYSKIIFCIYSKNEAGTAKDLAMKDYTGNKSLLNEDIAVFSNDVENKTYNGINMYQYHYSVLCGDEDATTWDSFFELGEYVYNIGICMANDIDNKDELMQNILNSVEISEIDFSEIGVLMRNVPDDEGTFEVEGSNWTIQVPNIYEIEQPSESSAIAMSMRSGAVFTLETMPSNGGTLNDVKKMFRESEDNLKKRNGVKLVKSATEINIGNYKYLMDVHEVVNENVKTYMYQYGAVKGDSIIVSVITIPEKTHSKFILDETNSILESLKLK